MKERFKDHLRFTKASIEVVVERIEMFPTGGGLDGQPGGNIVGILFKFRTKMFHGVREDPKLMEKTRPLSEQHVVKKAVPGCCALSGVSSEEACV